MKILRVIIELAIVCALCFVFFEVVNNIYYYDTSSPFPLQHEMRRARTDFLAGPFSLIMMGILILEFIRRSLAKERPQFEKYIYLPLILFVFLVGVFIAYSLKPM